VKAAREVGIAFASSSTSGQVQRAQLYERARGSLLACGRLMARSACVRGRSPPDLVSGHERRRARLKPADYCTCQRNRRLRKHMMFVAKHLRDNTLGLVNLDLNVSHLSPRIGHQHARSTRVTRCNPIAPKGFPGFITHVPFPLYIGEPVSFVIDIDWMPSKPTMPVHIRILGCSLESGILA